ncbi:hypothetical protein [Massilistercora timonensis]|uniref:hypothetical protein n=1 Tax=Massilistercora timonensis TaxID=2086584 RepID=UPI003AB1149D
MRYTEYHAGKAVIKDRKLLPGAMEKLAKIEDMTKIPQICCDEYCKYPNQRLRQGGAGGDLRGMRAGGAV